MLIIEKRQTGGRREGLWDRRPDKDGLKVWI